MHRHSGRADWMTLGFEPARGIDGQGSTLFGEPFRHSARTLPLRHQAHCLVLHQLGDGEAVVRLDEREIGEGDARACESARPGVRAAFELEHVALRHRQEILDVFGGAEGDRFAELERGRNIGQDDGGGAVGDEGAVRAFERARHARILLTLGPAELVAEVLANLGKRVAHAVLVILGGDPRKRVRLVSPALEVTRGDLPENTGEAAVDIGFLAHIRCLEQVATDFRTGRRRHLLGADHKHDAGGFGGDRLEALMNGGRPGGTSVLYPARTLEAQIRGGLKDQRGGKILGRETGIEMPEHDLVDIARGDASIGERLGRDPHDQTLERLALEATEEGVCPANDASGHDDLLSISILFVISGHCSQRQAPAPGLTCRILDVFYDHERWSGP